MILGYVFCFVDCVNGDKIVVRICVVRFVVFWIRLVWDVLG